MVSPAAPRRRNNADAAPTSGVSVSNVGVGCFFFVPDPDSNPRAYRPASRATSRSVFAVATTALVVAGGAGHPVASTTTASADAACAARVSTAPGYEPSPSFALAAFLAASATAATTAPQKSSESPSDAATARSAAARRPSERMAATRGSRSTV